MSRVLIVDDDPAVLFTLSEIVSSRGHDPIAVASGRQALAQIEQADAVIADFMMPEMDGLALLRAIRERDPQLPVIVVTAHGSERLAVRSIKEGAYDYLKKPFDIEEVSAALGRALEAHRLRIENRQLSAERALGRRIIGTAKPMRLLLEAVSRVADKDVTVLVRGETGTGKELIAGLLHAQSRRARGPLVRFNCAAIPQELAESELFGHTRGAFTGAQRDRRGYFSEANGGTLVLDEVGEIPLQIQGKLLRALQDGEIQPVGGTPQRVDVRIVACTHRDLAAEAHAGRFREDLRWRLQVVELSVPPLRARSEDIPELARELARSAAARFELDDVTLSSALVARLTSMAWPGNVRQLENTIARLIAFSQGGEIGVEALDDPGPPGGTGEAASSGSLREQMEALERQLITRALEDSGGNQSEAARRLGTSRPTFLDRAKRYKLL